MKRRFKLKRTRDDCVDTVGKEQTNGDGIRMKRTLHPDRPQGYVKDSLKTAGRHCRSRGKHGAWVCWAYNRRGRAWGRWWKERAVSSTQKFRRKSHQNLGSTALACTRGGKFRNKSLIPQRALLLNKLDPGEAHKARSQVWVTLLLTAKSPEGFWKVGRGNLSRQSLSGPASGKAMFKLYNYSALSRLHSAAISHWTYGQLLTVLGQITKAECWKSLK